MSKLFYKMWSSFLTAFGNVKIFSWPFWFVYDPNDYAVSGEKVLDIMEVIQDGDVILRGY